MNTNASKPSLADIEKYGNLGTAIATAVMNFDWAYKCSADEALARYGDIQNLVVTILAAMQPVADAEVEAVCADFDWISDWAAKGAYQGVVNANKRAAAVIRRLAAERDDVRRLLAEAVEALKDVRAGIMEAPEDVVSDTIWIPSDCSNETCVDRIDDVLARLDGAP